jgi:hypothetical protein
MAPAGSTFCPTASVRIKPAKNMSAAKAGLPAVRQILCVASAQLSLWGGRLLLYCRSVYWSPINAGKILVKHVPWDSLKHAAQSLPGYKRQRCNPAAARALRLYFGIENKSSGHPLVNHLGKQR